jgi:hypothetical protein
MSGPFPVLQTYRDVNASSSLAFVCEADVAVRINNSAVGSIMGNYGKVISYAVPGIPSGYMACANKFNALSGNVACKQAGYDLGRGSSGSAREESGGVAPRIIVGTGCGGTGTCVGSRRGCRPCSSNYHVQCTLASCPCPAPVSLAGRELSRRLCRQPERGCGAVLGVLMPGPAHHPHGALWCWLGTT